MGALADNENVVLAAARRGISTPRIAMSFGVSQQAVKQFLASRGVDYIRLPSSSGEPVVSFRTCKNCGETYARLGRAELSRRAGYCSPQCVGLAHLEMDAGIVDAAIAARTAGQSWRSIAKQHKHPAQVIQRWIWMYLSENGMLTHATLERIWNPPRVRIDGSGPRWGSYQWLMKNRKLTAKYGYPRG
jgi:hypothetical protein